MLKSDVANKFICRSGDCNEIATWEATVGYGYNRVGDWTGKFCGAHLERVLPLKMSEMMRGQMIVIERLS